MRPYGLLKQGTEGAADDVTATCVVWSDTSNEWVVDGVIVESVIAEPDGTSIITCSTFHLSLFVIADETAPSGGWAAFGQLPGIGVLQQVRRFTAFGSIACILRGSRRPRHVRGRVCLYFRLRRHGTRPLSTLFCRSRPNRVSSHDSVSM